MMMMHPFTTNKYAIVA